jgi:hypothetical protein
MLIAFIWIMSVVFTFILPSPWRSLVSIEIFSAQMFPMLKRPRFISTEYVSIEMKNFQEEDFI